MRRILVVALIPFILLCACISQKNCEEIQEQELRDLCYSSLALAESDEKICDKIQNTTTADLCYQTVAYMKQDPVICEKIQDHLKKGECVQEIGELMTTTTSTTTTLVSSEEKNVSASTDKKTYRRNVTLEGDYIYGDTINLTIKNNIEEDIFFDKSMIEPFTSMYIECLLDGGWRICSGLQGEAEYPPDYSSDRWMQTATKLKAGEEHIHRYMITSTTEWNPYTAGRYRFRLQYTLGLKERDDWMNKSLFENIYSNEFTITED